MDEDSELPSIPWLIAVIQRISQWLVAKQLGGLSWRDLHLVHPFPSRNYTIAVLSCHFSLPSFSDLFNEHISSIISEMC